MPFPSTVVYLRRECCAKAITKNTHLFKKRAAPSLLYSSFSQDFVNIFQRHFCFVCRPFFIFFIVVMKFSTVLFAAVANAAPHCSFTSPVQSPVLGHTNTFTQTHSRTSRARPTGRPSVSPLTTTAMDPLPTSRLTLSATTS